MYRYNTIQYNTIQYNTIQYKLEMGRPKYTDNPEELYSTSIVRLPLSLSFYLFLSFSLSLSFSLFLSVFGIRTKQGHWGTHQT